MREKRSGVLIWVTGLFGAGKSTLTQAVVREIPELSFVETFVTRPPRESETDTLGELTFVTREEYKKLRARSSLWDHSEVAGHFYGNDVTTIRKQLGRGQNLICPVAPDVPMLDGMRKIYEIKPILVWIDVPLRVANKRLQVSRPDRIKHHYQDEVTRKTFLKLADYIFAPIGNLEEDTVSFVDLVKKIMAHPAQPPANTAMDRGSTPLAASGA